MTRGSNSGAQKMKGITTHLPKLDSLEAGATAILQQHWRGGRRLGKRRGEIGRTREMTGADVILISTWYFYFSDKNDFKKLSALPTKNETEAIWTKIAS